MKKSIVILLTVFILLTGCSHTDEEKNGQRITDSVISIGAVESESSNFDKQKLTFEITIENADDVRIVDSVHVIPSMNVKDRVIETKKQGITYNQDTIEMNGEIIFDSRGLTKEEMTNFEPYIKGLQFIGDNNKEYLLVNNLDG
ncbi:hypothetical protein [Oceanobacillus senegalensis]|uniref:hypothetical protein n=1 Tax=Oceanobacillus senegalensis TaxID=1936063 RepID=UPI000A31314A|nr:hypothetical protein [Oceanobacillus senegalensis]